jgi:divalent metal cation (Fe/Co/Zn/Cd) transporter
MKNLGCFIVGCLIVIFTVSGIATLISLILGGINENTEIWAGIFSVASIMLGISLVLYDDTDEPFVNF